MNRPKLFAWIAAALVVAVALLGTRPASPVRGFDLQTVAGLPVLEGGRVKPLDSVARNSLLVIRSQQSFTFEGRTISATEWLLDLMLRPEVADRQPVFVINDPDVLGLLGQRQTSNRYFAFGVLIPHIEEIERQASAAQHLEPQQRSRFQGAVVGLYQNLLLYHRLRNTLQLAGGPPLAAELTGPGDPEAGRRLQALQELAFFRPLPPAAGQGPEGWRSVGEALADRVPGSPVHPALTPLARLGLAYGAQDPAAFNAAAQGLAAYASAERPADRDLARHEHIFNRAQPFMNGMVAYVLAMLGVFGAWALAVLPGGRERSELVRSVAFGLLAGAVLVHTAGLAFRILLQGRPPVTNLYSSAIFVGWGAALLGLALERMYRRGFGLAVAAASGFASLLVAQNLATSGDTMEMMRAVLDSNFWLATHVVTITIGYSGTFVAGALGIAYALRRLFSREPDPETTKGLVAMTYGILCFSLLFSFVGTVLGGIWADQSWGRFWGWDPKENGALLIVLWNAVILHARWGGYAKDRGIMAMAIFGNVITSLSWFGVNMLGVGLHSYGFMDKAFWALTGFIATQLLFIGLCYLPPRFWASPRTEA